MVLVTPLLVLMLLFVVLCGRLVTAQIDLHAAASSGARAGSLARDVPAARIAATRTAEATLTAHGRLCRPADIHVDTHEARPGGAVKVTVSCPVQLRDLLLVGVPGQRRLTATATSPIDRWRAVP
jgi:Flp pilus assembly protein TadG